MAERAHPKDPGFQDRFFGIVKSRYKRKLNGRYNFCNEFIKNRVVLDIPCGVGWGTSLLKGASCITGIDISKEAIVYAQNHYGNKKRKFVIGEMENIPLRDDSQDVLICLEGFEHVTKRAGLKFIKESKRVVRENGILILTCPVLNERGQTTGNPYHLSEYPENELIALINDNFRILSLERIEGPDGPEYRAVLENLKKVLNRS